MLYCFQPGMWTTKIQMLKGTLGPRIALTRSSRMAVTIVYEKLSQVLQYNSSSFLCARLLSLHYFLADLVCFLIYFFQHDLEYNFSFCWAPFTESFFSLAPLLRRISRSCASTNSTELNCVDQDLL